MFISSSVNAPGRPPVCHPTIPAILPAKLVVRSLLDDFKSIGRTVVIADTTLSFFCCPKATTTVSSNSCTSSSIVTRNVSFAIFSVKSSVFFLNPINVNSNVPLVMGKSRANHPWAFVDVPMVSPETFTVTPGMDCFCLSKTYPFTRTDFGFSSSTFSRITTTFRSKVNANPNPGNNSSNTFPSSRFSAFTLTIPFVCIKA